MAWPSRGFARAGTFRFRGIALAILLRNLPVHPELLRQARYSRLIFSNSSTLRLLSIAQPSWLASVYRLGWGQIKRPKCGAGESSGITWASRQLGEARLQRLKGCGKR